MQGVSGKQHQLLPLYVRSVEVYTQDAGYCALDFFTVSIYKDSKKLGYRKS